MVCVALFGGNKVDGSMLDPGERVVSLALFGGIELDFAAAPPPPAVDVLIFAVFGGASLRVRPERAVRLRGFSLFGGRHVDPPCLPPAAERATLTPPADADDDLDLPLEVSAYAIFGGVSVARGTQEENRP